MKNDRGRAGTFLQTTRNYVDGRALCSRGRVGDIPGVAQGSFHDSSRSANRVNAQTHVLQNKKTTMYTRVERRGYHGEDIGAACFSSLSGEALSS